MEARRNCWWFACSATNIGPKMATRTTKSSQATEATASGEAKNICHLGESSIRLNADLFAVVRRPWS